MADFVEISSIDIYGLTKSVTKQRFLRVSHKRYSRISIDQFYISISFLFGLLILFLSILFFLSFLFFVPTIFFPAHSIPVLLGGSKNFVVLHKKNWLVLLGGGEALSSSIEQLELLMYSLVIMIVGLPRFVGCSSCCLLLAFHLCLLIWLLLFLNNFYDRIFIIIFRLKKMGNCVLFKKQKNN